METKVSFTLPAALVSDAVSGVLVGEFNNWNPEEGIFLEKQDDGSMVAELVLSAGKTYEYRYLLNDGRWVNDNNEKKFSDVYGQQVENCIIEVPEIKTAITAEVKSGEKKKAVKKVKKAVEATTADDLTKIAGINKKIAGVLAKENIKSFKELSKITIKKLLLIIDGMDANTVLNPATWPKQAKLAATGNWGELEKLQKELSASK